VVKPLRHGLVNLDRQRVVNLVGISNTMPLLAENLNILLNEDGNALFA
jgi:hypothetical protein